MPRDHLLIEPQSRERSVALGSFENSVNCVDQLRPAAIVDGQVDQQPAIARGGFNGGEQLVSNRGGKLIETPDRLQPDIVLLQYGKLMAQIEAQQTPKRFDLSAGPLPVFYRERV